MPEYLDITKSGVIIADNRDKYFKEVLPNFQNNGAERTGTQVYQDKAGRRIIADTYRFPSGTEFIVGYYQTVTEGKSSLESLLDELEEEEW